MVGLSSHSKRMYLKFHFTFLESPFINLQLDKTPQFVPTITKKNAQKTQVDIHCLFSLLNKSSPRFTTSNEYENGEVSSLNGEISKQDRIITV